MEHISMCLNWSLSSENASLAYATIENYIPFGLRPNHLQTVITGSPTLRYISLQGIDDKRVKPIHYATLTHSA